MHGDHAPRDWSSAGPRRRFRDASRAIAPGVRPRRHSSISSQNRSPSAGSGPAARRFGPGADLCQDGPVASAGCRGAPHILTTESRLLMAPSSKTQWSGVRPHRTWRPDSPDCVDDSAGCHQHQRDPQRFVLCQQGRHARPRGSERRGGGVTGTVSSRRTSRTTHAVLIEKDERDLWRDRRSASGSRPMTTR